MEAEEGDIDGMGNAAAMASMMGGSYSAGMGVIPEEAA